MPDATVETTFLTVLTEDFFSKSPELLSETVDYLKLEVAASTAGSLANFLMLVILINEWTGFALTALAIQVCDFGLSMYSLIRLNLHHLKLFLQAHSRVLIEKIITNFIATNFCNFLFN